MHVQTKLDSLKKMTPENQLALIKKEIKITPTIITSFLASQILLETAEAGFRNRQISQAQVTKLAGVMSRNQWNPATGETIAITTEIHEGKKLRVLLNGQHRFKAVVKSGKDIVALIVSGVSRESFKEMDQGKARDIKAMAQMDNWIRPAQTTGAAELYYVWKTKASPLMKLTGYTKPEMYQLYMDLEIQGELEKTVEDYWDVIEAAKLNNVQLKVMLLLITLWKKINSDAVMELSKYLIVPDDNPMSKSAAFELTLRRLNNQFDVDRNLLGNGMSRGKQMEYLLKMLCLAWALYTQDLHPCITQEDFDEIIEVYMYDKKIPGITAVPWIDIFKYSYIDL